MEKQVGDLGTCKGFYKCPHNFEISGEQCKHLALLRVAEKRVSNSLLARTARWIPAHLSHAIIANWPRRRKALSNTSGSCCLEASRQPFVFMSVGPGSPNLWWTKLSPKLCINKRCLGSKGPFFMWTDCSQNKFRWKTETFSQVLAEL